MHTHTHTHTCLIDANRVFNGRQQLWGHLGAWRRHAEIDGVHVKVRVEVLLAAPQRLGIRVTLHGMSPSVARGIGRLRLPG